MILVCTLTNVADTLLENKVVATTLNELYSYIAKPKLREVIMKDDFVDAYFTDTSLRVFIKEAKRLNEFLKFKVSTSMSNINIDTTEAVIHMDSRDELIDYVVRKENSLTLLKDALNTVHDAHDASLAAASKLSTMHLEVNKERDLRETTERKYKNLEEQYTIVHNSLDSLLRRINYQYGIEMSPEKMYGLDIRVNNYQKTLYIKEITRVKYTDTMIYYLQEVMRVLYGVRARLLVLESRDAYGKAFMYPTCKSHLELTYQDIFNSDIFVPGYQSKLMEMVLNNPAGIPYLIILDRTGSLYPFLRGNNVETIYTVSTLKDVPFELKRGDCISYHKDTLHIKHIENFDKLTVEEKLAKYSEMHIITSLVDRMERR